MGVVLATALARFAVQEAIVDHLDGESARPVFIAVSGYANHLACAKHLGVLLAGDLARHLEEHLQQLAFDWNIICMDEQAGLAYVVDRARDQRVSALASEFHGQCSVQAARARRPRRFPDDVLVGNRPTSVPHSLPQPLHGWPIVLIFVAADQADLIVVALRALARPSKFVSADSWKQLLEEFARHTLHLAGVNRRQRRRGTKESYRK